MSTVPIDAIFYGTAIGTVSTKNFVVPANDLYAGGILGTPGNTFLGPDPASDDYIYVSSGTYNTSTNLFSVPRTFAVNKVKPNCTNSPGITFMTTLPLKFVSFNTGRTAAGSRLSWKIADNIDLQKFDVLLSFDGLSYQNIATISATGQKTDYEFSDVQRANRICYYKIKAVEHSGNVIYSQVQRISSVDQTTMVLYANPVKQFGDIHLTFSSKALRLVNVYNATGKLMISLKSENAGLNIPTSGWNKGLYILKVKDEREWIISRKVIIE